MWVIGQIVCVRRRGVLGSVRCLDEGDIQVTVVPPLFPDQRGRHMVRHAVPVANHPQKFAVFGGI